MQTRLARGLALVALLLLGTGSAPLRADHRLCTMSGILVEGNAPEDVADACSAVRSAAPFFEIAGLPTPSNLPIRLVDESSSPFLDEHEIGHYDGRLHAIVMRDYRTAAARSVKTAPGLWAIVSRADWQSYIVHELTHAAIYQEHGRNHPSRAVHEYVAALAQISVLPEAELASLLDAHRDLEAFEQESEITEIYYAFNPRSFAVKSYKHYRQQTDPRAFLRKFLHSR